MKRKLYEVHDVTGWSAHIPYMPKVLANKTAKKMSRQTQRDRPRWRMSTCKYTISSTSIVTTDGSPHGAKDWYAYFYG